MMTDPIKQFTGCYRFLSNFYPSMIKGIDGEIYITVEHAYQAAKCKHERDALRIRRTLSPGVVKRMVKRMTKKEDWLMKRQLYMCVLVSAKFKDIQHLKEKLLATGNAELIEGNHWGDRYWGVCHGKGENNLGKILMLVREELRNGEG